MRTTLAVITLALMATNLAAQQNSMRKPDVESLILQLGSNDGGERDQAYEQLKHDPEALRDSKVKAALLDLLDRETQRMIGAPRAGDNEDDIGTEGFAEYFSSLSSTASSIGNWDDPHEACILVRGAGVPPSRSSTEAALRERVAWPCLKEMSVSRFPLERISASRIVMELSARAGDSIDPGIAKESKETVVTLLHDQNESVRGETINSLEKFGTKDMIPALRQVAESDQAVGKTTHGYWLRGRAAKAISTIQRRDEQR